MPNISHITMVPLGEGGYYCFPHFTEEKVEALRVMNFSNFHLCYFLSFVILKEVFSA